MDQETINSIVYDYQHGSRLCEISKKYGKPSSNIIGLLKSRGVFVATQKRFSDHEIMIIKLHYPTSNKEDMLKLLPFHSWGSIVTKASDLGIKQAEKWTADDIELLHDACEQGLSTKCIVELFDWKFSTCVIDCKISKLRFLRRVPWTESEMNIIKENYEAISINALCKMLPGRTRETIKTYANRLGLISKDWSDRMSSIASYRDLCHFIRSNNYAWKQASMQACNYQCVVTKERFDDIHHLVGFNQLFEQMLSENPDVRLCDSIQDYSLDELEYILSCFLDVQSRYPLGVCLTKDIHTQFHSSYGFGNNTEAQFLEFIKNYNTTNPVTITA